MPWIKCANCGADVESEEPMCTKCGRPILVEMRTGGSITIIVALLLGALVIIGGLAWILSVPAFENGKSIGSSCQVDGLGHGSCRFTNTGWGPGFQCLKVTLTDGHGDFADSKPVCSGLVWPGETSKRSIVVAVGHMCAAVSVISLNHHKACAMNTHYVGADVLGWRGGGNVQVGTFGEATGMHGATVGVHKMAGAGIDSEATGGIGAIQAKDGGSDVKAIKKASAKATDGKMASITCDEISADNPAHVENMGRLAKEAHLPDSYFSRYDEDVVSGLCAGDSGDVQNDVDSGFVKAGEVESIARVLGKTVHLRARSQAGKSYGYAREKFSAMGLCEACADNTAIYYTSKPASRCGQLAKHALEGDPEAVKELSTFPDYCELH